MKTHKIIIQLLIPLVSSTFVMSGDELELEAESRVRTEYEEAKVAILPESWKQDTTKWKMVADPSAILVKHARDYLKSKGVEDADKHGAVLYDLGNGHRVLMIVCTKSAGRIAKYYCLGYEKLDDETKDPDLVWVKYIERVLKFKDAVLPAKNKYVRDPSLTPLKNQNKVAIWVPGKPGFVFNPYTSNVVDVRGMPLGSLAKDPEDSVNRSFRIPSALKK